MTVEPLVPAHIDLRDFPFMPLEVARLRDSSIVDEISGDEFRAAILLWCASWHQVPAGSLPTDRKQLSKFAGYGRVVAEWDKVAEGALYGWIECSDGRLYHPVIAEKAIEAWDKKAEFTNRAAARAEQAKAAAGAKWGESQNKQNRSQRLAEARAKAKHTDEEWRSLLALFDNACVRCGSHERIVKDHITPIYQGGSDGIENLQPLCHSCNSAKGPDRTDHRDTARPGWRADFDAANGTPAEMPAGLAKTPAKRLPKGKGEGQGQGEAATRASAREAPPSLPTITDTAQFAAWIRTLVGQEPVLFAHDTQSLARLLDEGCTLADVEAGIAAAMAKPDFRPRQWSQLAGWVRGAAKDRLEAEAKAAPLARSVAKPPVDPDQDRRNRLAKATAHFRGQWRQGWPEEMLPGHSACTTEADVIEEARLAVEREAAVYANGLPARRDRSGRAAA